MHEDKNWLLIHLFRVLKCLIISLQYTIVRQTEPFVWLVQCSAAVFRCRNWVPGHWELILWEAGCGLDSASKLYGRESQWDGQGDAKPVPPVTTAVIMYEKERQVSGP